MLNNHHTTWFNNKSKLSDTSHYIQQMQLRLQQPKIQTKIITAVARFLTITNGKPSKIRHYNERERENSEQLNWWKMPESSSLRGREKPLFIWTIFTRFWQYRYSSAAEWLLILEEKTATIRIPFQISYGKLRQRNIHTVSTWRGPHVQVRASSAKNKTCACRVPSNCSNRIFLH